MIVPVAVRQLLSECKIHGNGDAQVMLSDAEVYILLYLSCADLGWDCGSIGLRTVDVPSADYYQIPVSWFIAYETKTLSPQCLLDILAAAVSKHPDYGLFIKNLTALHRRRVKYARILASQPLATVDQIGPRVLLEFGACDTTLLANWMLWRKWIYDIDNRSAQETGYFFEPVLASCLGGEAIGARNSPVKRLDSNGRPTVLGRQVDCFVAASNRIYELKLRVSIAASGQGRFGEELSFPKECRAAGFEPFLLVLDPTPSNRLKELEAAFVGAKGKCLKGVDAWKHMEDAAGDVMSVFIKKYIKPPLDTYETASPATPAAISLTWSDSQIDITSQGNHYVIPRTSSEEPDS